MTTNNDPLVGIEPVDHSDDLPALRRLLNVPADMAGYRDNPTRWDGINHWGDLLECSALLEHIAFLMNQAEAKR